MVKVEIDKELFKPFERYGGGFLLRVIESEGDSSCLCLEWLYVPSGEGDEKARIVSSLVDAKYSRDEMDAIRNNYDLVRDGTAGEKTREYTEEYLAMQAWRQEAKSVASAIIDEMNDNS